MSPTPGRRSGGAALQKLILFFLLLSFPLTAVSHEFTSQDRPFSQGGDAEIPPEFLDPWGCTKASAADMRLIDEGNRKRDRFLARCAKETNHSPWCEQLIRPNPRSVSVFRCTYGVNRLHQLIHPDENTWAYAIRAVRLIQQLTQKGLRICQIYNWWRPEPYNNNVGGASGRHPYGTSVDVSFCSDADADRGFRELCKLRRQGQLRAIGHYGTSNLHLGVGDRNANTWGRSCP